MGRECPRPSVDLTVSQGTMLVSIARAALDQAASAREPSFTGPEEGFLKARRGAFVTLSRLDGELRGCIGFPYPVKPLGEAVFEAAVGAATRDPRFPRVEARELCSLTVEVSALTEPEDIEVEPLGRPGHVRVGTDGLIVTGFGRSGLLLPQVGAEMRLAPEEFLSLTCEKAGLPPDSWLSRGTKVQRFQAEVFREATPGGRVGGPTAPA